MNLTLALLAGLFLLLPGLTALAAWNGMSPRHGAQRPELPLTAASTLFVVLSVSLVAHVVGVLIVDLICLASIEAGRLDPKHWPTIVTWPTPFEAAIAMQGSDGKAVSVGGLAVLVSQTALECLLVFWIIAGRGFDLLLDRMDLQAQGWVYSNIVRPHRHGQTPIAHVLTTLTDGALGVGYYGVVEHARQNADGELKVLSLRQPEAFVYELTPKTGGRTPTAAKVKIHEGRILPGVVVLEAARIHNIVIRYLAASPAAEIELNKEVEAALAEAKKEGQETRAARRRESRKSKTPTPAAPKRRRGDG
ncbi:hypothetical protein [Caulobacter sp.]|uniref:hypothetical protein n=1 Tax=Caulobacter sp. TaxID=78 RepID=UPI0031D454CC